MKKLFSALVLFATVLTYSILPACAEPYEFRADAHFSKNVRIEGTINQTGATVLGNTSLQINDTAGNNTTTIKQNSDEAANRTLNIPPLGANADMVVTVGDQTIAGNKTLSGNTAVGGTLNVTGAVTLTAPLTAANIQTGSAKRQVFVAYLSPNTGAAVDSTVYRATIFPGRAGTVTRISSGCQTAPTVGTDTIKVLKGSSAGNTMLNAASFDANTLTANQVTTHTLTGTSADLQIAASGAGSCIYCEYSAGVQTVDAIGLEVTVEFEPTDF